MATHSNGISACNCNANSLSAPTRPLAAVPKLRRSMVAPGRSALTGLVEIDETEIACRSKHDPSPAAEAQPSRQDAHRRRRRGPGRRRWPGRIRLAECQTTRLTACIPSSHNLAPGATAKPTDGQLSGAPGVTTTPTSSADGRPFVLPGCTGSSPTSIWALGVYPASPPASPIPRRFVFRFNAAAPHAAFRSLLASPPATPSPTNVDLTGSRHKP